MAIDIMTVRPGQFLVLRPSSHCIQHTSAVRGISIYAAGCDGLFLAATFNEEEMEGAGGAGGATVDLEYIAGNRYASGSSYNFIMDDDAYCDIVDVLTIEDSNRLDEVIDRLTYEYTTELA